MPRYPGNIRNVFATRCAILSQSATDLVHARDDLYEARDLESMVACADYMRRVGALLTQAAINTEAQIQQMKEGW